MRQDANTDRPNGRRLPPTMERNALIRGIAISLLAGTMAAGVPIVAEAQEDVLERADIKTSSSDLSKLITDLVGTAATAEEVLRTVKEMEIEEQDKTVNQFFEDMKTKVNETLNRLSPNSVLMDNLEGAKANMVVLQRWFERQPPSYPNRDQLIMRTAEVIKGYDESAGTILSGRKEAQDALRELIRAQFYAQMERKVKTAEDSVDVTRRLVTSLEAVSEKLIELAELEKGLPAISN